MDIEKIEPEFLSWYAALQIEKSDETLAARWRGLCALVARADRSTIETLLEFVIGFEVAADKEAKIRSIFQEADESFPNEGNAAEMKLLAEAAIAFLLAHQTKSELKAETALLTSSSLFMRDGVGVRVSLAERTKDAIKQLGESARRRPSNMDEEVTPEIDITAVMEAFTGANQLPQMKAIFSALAEETGSGLSELLEIMDRRFATLLRKIDKKDEEIDILWWIIGGHSAYHKAPYASLLPGTRALSAAVDLAHCTRFLPGPLSYSAMLSRSGVGNESGLEIPSVINNAEYDLLKSIVVPGAGRLTPAHLAIAKRIEVEGDESWAVPWSKMCRVPLDRKMTELEFASMFYIERLAMGQYKTQ